LDAGSANSISQVPCPRLVLLADLLKLRYFAGVPLKDAAELLNISPATAKRRWAFARAFLYGELAD
jgi:DNA-directed RNA polymerase specialized sigma24 family protein